MEIRRAKYIKMSNHDWNTSKNKLTLCGSISSDFRFVSQEPNKNSDKGQRCCSVCDLSRHFGI